MMVNISWPGNNVHCVFLVCNSQGWFGEHRLQVGSIVLVLSTVDKSTHFLEVEDSKDVEQPSPWNKKM
jgi:hypothetical protein